MIKEITIKVFKLCKLCLYNRIMLISAIITTSISLLAEIFFVSDFLRDLMNYMLYKSNNESVIIIFLYNMPLLIMAALFESISNYLKRILNVNTRINLQKYIYNIFLYEKNNYKSKHTGETISIFLNDIPLAINTLIDVLIRVYSSIVVALVLFVYLLSINTKLVIVVFIIATIAWSYSLCFAKKIYKIQMEIQKKKANVLSSNKNILDSMANSRIYGTKKFVLGMSNKNIIQLCNSGKKWGRYSAMLGGLNNAFMNISEGILMFIVGMLFCKGYLSLANIMAISYLSKALINVFCVSRYLVDIQSSIVGIDRIFEYQRNTEIEKIMICKDRYENTMFCDNIIELKDLTFKYTENMYICRNMSIIIPKASCTIFWGKSGAGKSTLIKLIMGMLGDYTGEIIVNGRNIREWELLKFRDLFSVVPQESFLFTGSIYENITICKPNVSDKEVETVIEKVGLQEYIDSLPDGVNSHITENNKNLSGGQQQKISIARALIKDAPIYIFDEPTASLDALSENKIIKIIEELKVDKTVILITHNKKLFSLGDKIIYLKKEESILEDKL